MEVGYGQVYVIEFIAKVTPWNKIHTLRVSERKVRPKVTTGKSNIYAYAPGKSGRLHCDEWNVTSLQEDSNSSAHLNQRVPSRTTENEMAPADRGILHSSNLVRTEIRRQNPARIGLYVVDEYCSPKL